MTERSTTDRTAGASRRLRMAVKRAFDLLVAGLGLLLLSPLFLIVALLVLGTSGRPVLFRQTRLGHLGRPFILMKFRTMRETRDAGGQPLPDHERLTAVGRLLRRTSLDELPQLLNVLGGSLSLVGPRPLLPEYRDLYTAEEWRRHEVRPGIAGPVQAYGRNTLTWREKLALDVWYVDHWTLRMDLRLFLLSLWKTVKQEGISAAGHATMPPFLGTAREGIDDGAGPSAPGVAER